jgi:hypothetical protein
MGGIFGYFLKVMNGIDKHQLNQHPFRNLKSLDEIPFKKKKSYFFSNK